MHNKVIAVLPLITTLLLAQGLCSQELFVFTEPASNMPAKSVSAKVSARYLKDRISNIITQRYTPEIMLGLSKRWMLHGAITISDMYSSAIRWESGRVYAKYRFLSLDEVHRHFRMAVFGEYALSRNDLMFDELSIQGDHSGGQTGLILTGLLHKFALSSAVAYTAITTRPPKGSDEDYPRQAVDYSISGGLLVLPLRYTSFRQTNLNIYTELLGQRALDTRKFYIDLAPAIQLIFNSNVKINVGHRFQLSGNMQRMANNSWQIGIERTFLGALEKK